MYDIDAKKMILSGGLGSHTIKARVNNKPEIVVVNFHG
jgi:predicted MPP superfamily phosphohydrolase